MNTLLDTLPDLAADLPHFERAISEFANLLGLPLTALTVDHISLRCHQKSTAERWAAGLEQCGECFSTAIIANRPINLYKLQQPLPLLDWLIPVVELPWPGQKLYRHEGWEHIEIVLAGDPETLGQRAMALIDDQGLLLPGVSFKTRQPETQPGILMNTTLAVTNGEVTIKFHPWSIEAVVASEQAADPSLVVGRG